MRWHLCVGLLAVASVVLPGCTESADDGGDVSIDLGASPEFVNRMVSGYRPLGLVSVGGSSGQFTLVGTSSLNGVTVTFVPAELSAGGVAEVWVDLPETDSDVPFTVDVRDSAGATSGVTFSATLVPGVDDLAATAEDIVAVFLERIGDEVPGLPDAVADLPSGTPVAGLLVVSHYAWFTEEYEIGLSWHIMVAPDDFAEVYLRPRDELVPTVAYRINSGSTALEGGQYTFERVDPPVEVTR